MPVSTTVKKQEANPPSKPIKPSKRYYIPTPKTQAFQDLFGGVPVGTLTGFLGAPEACKTVTATQICTEVAIIDKGNTLVFDTENKFLQHVGLASGFTQRFGTDVNPVRVKLDVTTTGAGDKKKTRIDFEFEDDPDPNAVNIFVVHTPNLKKLTAAWGQGLDIKIFESGKFKVMVDFSAYWPDVPESPLGQFIEKHNIRSILVDSITNPFDIMPAVSENFPARSDATQVWAIQMHEYAAHYSIPILVTCHESRNDTNPFSKQLKYEGGKAIGYNIPFWAYLLRANEQGLLPKSATKPKTLKSTERAIFCSRHGANTIQPWKEVRYMTVGETGMTEGSEDDETDDE